MQLHSRETYDGGVRVFGMQSAFATHGDLWVTTRSWKAGDGRGCVGARELDGQQPDSAAARSGLAWEACAPRRVGLRLG